jgi:hypothetical protein
VKEVRNVLSFLTTGNNVTSGKFTTGIVDTRVENFTTGAEFWDFIGTKLLRVFSLLFTVTSTVLADLLPFPLEQKWFETAL